MAPRFRNRPNRAHQLPDGAMLWHSRSVAVVAHILVTVGGQDQVLLGLRGPACPDHVGDWVLPCGYLDWDESAPEAVRREVWEETGLDLGALAPVAGSLEQPWLVSSEPTDARQNVVLHYGARFECDALPPVRCDHAEPGECADVRFFPVREALAMKLAFGHQHFLGRALHLLGRAQRLAP